MLIESSSGIRGIYGKGLTDEIARRYAFFYAELLRKREKKTFVVVGRDTRKSSERLREAIIGGLDCDIIDVGIATTPAVEFAVRHFNAHGGVIITASHNEPEWNGLKFLDNDGAVLRPKDIGNIIESFRKAKDLDEYEFLKKYGNKKNRLKIKKIIKEYIVAHYTKFLFNTVGKKNIERIRKSNFKVIIDPNGGTAFIAKDILEKIGVKVVPINFDIGRFKRVIEPNEKSLDYLKKIIKKERVDFAAGFDCDGDRMELMLEEGVVNGHYLLAMAVDYVLSDAKNPKKIRVVTNDATSNIVREAVNRHCANLVETEVGEINVVDMMEVLESPIGGEGSSSGVILAPSKCRDGILTLLLALSIIAKNKKPLIELIEDYPKYFTLTEKIRFDIKNHDKIKKKIKDYYLKKGFKIQETGGIKGGLKVFIDETSFVWFRASKTEGDIFRVMADSKNLNTSKKLIREAIGLF